MVWQFCVVSEAKADLLGQKPLANISGYANHSQSPASFIIAQSGAVSKLLHTANGKRCGFDLFEINGTALVVALSMVAELSIDRKAVNVNGGACIIGHICGCSGARIIVALIHALMKRNLKRGVAAICIGGGEAIAICRIITSRLRQPCRRT